MSNIQKADSDLTKFIEILHNNPKIKPFNEDIYLISVNVAGLMFIEDVDAIFSKLKKGSFLQLIREKQNYHDNFAILVNYDGEKIGYVPKKHNVVLANLMDAGKELYGVIEEVSLEKAVYVGEDDYRNVRFKIFMKD